MIIKHGNIKIEIPYEKYFFEKFIKEFPFETIMKKSMEEFAAYMEKHAKMSKPGKSDDNGERQKPV